MKSTVSTFEIGTLFAFSNKHFLVVVWVALDRGSVSVVGKLA